MVARRSASQQEAALERLAALLATRNERERTVRACEIGTPAHEIVGYTERHHIDPIVMGAHTHGPTFQMVAGSVAECVLGRAPCPVVAVQGVARPVSRGAGRSVGAV